MVERVSFKNREAFKCNVCGFVYAERATAKECEEYCRKHHSCSTEITKKALR